MGDSHSAAIKTDGTLWAWGNNSFGQIADNSTVNKSSPVQVGADTNWSKVAGSKEGTYIIKTDGTLWSVGRNVFGENGHNNEIPNSSPVQIGSLTNWSDIEVGEYFVIAVRSDGTLWVWGHNAGGQMGQNNSGVNYSSPVQVGSGTGWLLVAAQNEASFAGEGA